MDGMDLSLADEAAKGWWRRGSLDKGCRHLPATALHLGMRDMRQDAGQKDNGRPIPSTSTVLWLRIPVPAMTTRISHH